MSPPALRLDTPPADAIAVDSEGAEVVLTVAAGVEIVLTGPAAGAYLTRLAGILSTTRALLTTGASN